MSAPHRRSRIFKRLASLATGAALFALAACSPERSTQPDAVPLAPGTFSIRVRGAAERTVAGRAIFSTDLASSGIGTAFSFRDGRDESEMRHALYLYRWTTAPIAPGTYRIVPNDEGASPDDFVGGIGLDTGDSSRARACVALEGTIEVRATTEGRIAGTVWFTGACLSLEGLDAVPVVIEGRFEAKEGALGIHTSR